MTANPGRRLISVATVPDEAPDVARGAALVDVPERNRYELRADDGTLLGLADYRRDGSTLVVPHVEVDPRLRGHGVGGRLVRHVLDDVRDRGLVVDPVCPYVRLWIRRNPEYAHVSARPPRERAEYG